MALVSAYRRNPLMHAEPACMPVASAAVHGKVNTAGALSFIFNLRVLSKWRHYFGSLGDPRRFSLIHIRIEIKCHFIG